jgi:hypothetical protein
VHGNETTDDEVIPVISTHAVLDELYAALSFNEELLPEAVRLALVCNLLKPVDTVAESRAIISDLLSLDTALTDYSDLIFQINRRKTLATGIEINRLLRWHSLSLQSFIINMPGQQGIATPAIKEKHAAALMLDINTVVGPRVFSGAQQLPIFQEMMVETLRLGELGVPTALMD